MEGLEPVHRAQDVGVERRLRSGDQLLDEDLIHQFARGRGDLAAAAHQVRLVRHRLEAPAVPLQREARRRQVDRHGLQAALEHQRPGHAGVVREVPLEEPVARVDAIHGAQVPASPGPAPDGDLRHLFEQEHPAARQIRGAGVGRGPFKAGAEALVGPPGCIRFELRPGESRRPGGHRRRIDPCAIPRLDGRRVPEHARRPGEFLVGEEAGLPVAHGEAGDAIHRAGGVEEEEADGPLLRVAVDADLVAQGLPGDGEAAVVRQLAPEQPVDALPAVEGVDAEPGDEQEVGLPGLDQDSGGDAVVVQVPGAPGRCRSRSRRRRCPSRGARPRGERRDRRAAAAVRACGRGGGGCPGRRMRGPKIWEMFSARVKSRGRRLSYKDTVR